MKAMDRHVPKLQKNEAALQERLDEQKSIGEITKSQDAAGKLVAEAKQLMKESNVFIKVSK